MSIHHAGSEADRFDAFDTLRAICVFPENMSSKQIRSHVGDLEFGLQRLKGLKSNWVTHLVASNVQSIQTELAAWNTLMGDPVGDEPGRQLFEDAA